MATLDLENLREEVVHFIRNGDVFSTTVRGVTTTTDNFTATAGQVNFTLTNSGVRNIRSLTVASVSKRFLHDYTVNWSTGVVTLNTGASLNDAVAIQYDYGTSDRIYPDMPRPDLKLTSYPRIGCQVTSLTTLDFGLGGASHLSEALVSIFVWVPANKDTSVASGIGGTENLTDAIKNIRGVIRTNAKEFYTTLFITPTTTSPILGNEDKKLLQQSHDFKAKFIVE